MVAGWCGCTRLMKFSLTSTSTSSEFMSTIWAIPPPPENCGETISPGCAFLTVTMPANGARITVSSS